LSQAAHGIGVGRPHVVVQLADGATFVLGSGDLIGRTWCATLHIDDPRVSEAHALVSLRGDKLRLLALRGRFAVDGRVLSEVDLEPGLRIVLAPPDVGFDVVDVVLPSHATGLTGDGLAITVLHGAVGLKVGADVEVVASTVSDAQAWVWPSGAGWRVRWPDGTVRDVGRDEVFDVAGRTFRLVAVPLSGTAPTRDGLPARATLRIVTRYETVHVHRADHPPVVLAGLSARLVTELAAFAAPVAWEVLAGELWPGADPNLARKRLDGALGRLRSTLREGGVRPDLVRATGLGDIELVLEPGDVVEEQA
jgi:hypothetical protein